MSCIGEENKPEKSSADDQSMDRAPRECAHELGAELFGVASATDYAAEFPDKPQPTTFIDVAQSIVVIGLPFEPGTVATVLRPELSGLRQRAAQQVGTAGVNPLGAERYLVSKENAMISQELTRMGYRIAKFLRHSGWKALHLSPAKQNDRSRTAPFYHMPAMYPASRGWGRWASTAAYLHPSSAPGSTLPLSLLTALSPAESPLSTSCALDARSVWNTVP